MGGPEEALPEFLPRRRRGRPCDFQPIMAEPGVILPEQQLDHQRGGELAEQEGVEVAEGDPPARQQDRRRRRSEPHLGRVAVPQADLAGPQQTVGGGEEAHQGKIL